MVNSIIKPGKGWRLLTHSTDVILRNAKCKVYESGRQRVIRERKKYVHAYIEGELIGTTPVQHTRLKLTYNPFKAGHFHWTDSPQPVEYCGTVVFDKHGVWAAF